MNSAEMNNAQITDYLKQAVELETVKYELSMARERLPICADDSFRNRNPLSSSPGSTPSFQDREPVLEFSESKPFFNRGPEIFLLSMAGIVLLLILLMLTKPRIVLEDPGTFLLAVIIVLACLGILVVRFKTQKKKLNDYYERERQAKIQYNNRLQEYKDKKKRAEETHEQEVAEWNKRHKEWHEENDRLKHQGEIFIQDNLTLINEAFKTTESSLQRLYSTDIVFPKYRNLNAVATMYEYFASGRVTQLTGPDGAYNLYESELRQNLIIGELKNINENLEQIKNNQYMLYQAVERVGNSLERMSHDVSSIAEDVKRMRADTASIAASSEITAICSQAIAQNTETMKYLMLVNG